MDKTINFPNLGLHLSNVGKEIHPFGFSIAFYGMIIACGMLLGVISASREAKRTGQNPENYYDMLLWAILSGVVGARIYYVIFSWDSYKDDLLSIFNIRQGGLAIYGGIIAAALVLAVYSRVKKMKFSLMADTCSMGLLIGQVLGRWGNFFNREAFGQYTNNLFAMQLPVSAVRENEITKQMWDHAQVIDGVKYIQVHPTFLYESLWNLCLLLFLFFFRKKKGYDGQIFAIYLCGYGMGRFWIEGLRTDQLLLWGSSLPVSRLLAAILCLSSFVYLLVRGIQKKRGLCRDTMK